MKVDALTRTALSLVVAFVALILLTLRATPSPSAGPSQYFVVKAPIDVKGLEETLNMYAKQGWELVQVHPGFTNTLILKK